MPRHTKRDRVRNSLAHLPTARRTDGDAASFSGQNSVAHARLGLLHEASERSTTSSGYVTISDKGRFASALLKGNRSLLTRISVCHP